MENCFLAERAAKPDPRAPERRPSKSKSRGPFGEGAKVGGPPASDPAPLLSQLDDPSPSSVGDILGCRALSPRTFTRGHKATLPHPQMDVLVERMNETSKDLLRKTAGAFPAQWDKYLDPLLFALWETPQTSTGVAPFKLVYGQHPLELL